MIKFAMMCAAALARAAGGGVACAYPLDDDGTFVTGSGLPVGFGGPATGAGQQRMDYTAGSDGAVILTANDPYGVDAFDIPASGTAYYEGTYVSGNATTAFLGIMVSSGGTLAGLGYVVTSTPTDELAIGVASDGTVSAKVNGTPSAISWQVGGPSLSVGQKFAPILAANLNTGQTCVLDLRTDGTSFVGTYGAGDTDLCSNALA